MILIDLKNYLEQRQSATLAELSLRFDMPESAVEPMMAHWVKKGVVVMQQSSGCGAGKCSGCQSQCSTTYRINGMTQQNIIPVFLKESPNKSSDRMKSEAPGAQEPECSSVT